MERALAQQPGHSLNYCDSKAPLAQQQQRQGNSRPHAVPPLPLHPQQPRADNNRQHAERRRPLSRPCDATFSRPPSRTRRQRPPHTHTRTRTPFRTHTRTRTRTRTHLPSPSSLRVCRSSFLRRPPLASAQPNNNQGLRNSRSLTARSADCCMMYSHFDVCSFERTHRFCLLTQSCDLLAIVSVSGLALI